MECTIIYPALSLLVKHLDLVIGSRQKLLISRLFIGPCTVVWFHCSAFRNHEGSTFTEKDRKKLDYRIGPTQT